jgi:hybrid cluster-associated redox disulfide protein
MTSASVLELTVVDVLVRLPGSARVFARHGMSCIGCPFAPFETIADAATSYGFDPIALSTALLHADPLVSREPEGLIP